MKRFRAVPLSVAFALFWAGCYAVPLPPAQLDGPGWKVQVGQAIWKPPGGRTELAGELVLALRAGGDCFVEFAKPPFALASARIAGEYWRLQMGDGTRQWGGKGKPPSRLGWFQLVRGLEGLGVADRWRFQRLPNDVWRLENSSTGEALEGSFAP